jgi:hypothetical protein
MKEIESFTVYVRCERGSWLATVCFGGGLNKFFECSTVRGALESAGELIEELNDEARNEREEIEHIYQSINETRGYK